MVAIDWLTREEGVNTIWSFTTKIMLIPLLYAFLDYMSSTVSTIQ